MTKKASWGNPTENRSEALNTGAPTDFDTTRQVVSEFDNVRTTRTDEAPAVTSNEAPKNEAPVETMTKDLPEKEAPREEQFDARREDRSVEKNEVAADSGDKVKARLFFKRGEQFAMFNVDDKKDVRWVPAGAAKYRSGVQVFERSVWMSYPSATQDKEVKSAVKLQP